jgi:hypothetical protein
MKLYCYGLAGLLSFAALGHAQLFSDNFTRGTDPGPLTPWLTNAGQWTVTGGTMQGGPSPTFNYGNAYITSNWVNFSAQARVRFPPAGAFGGGLGARLNPLTGAHYAAWVYPESSPGGSNVLRLIKFQNFTTFGYNGTSFAPIASANLANVGTTFHTVRMDVQTNFIAVFFDGALMISAQDTEAQYYTNGAVSLDMWTDASQYMMTVDDVTVSNLVLAAVADSYSATYGTQLTIGAPGVLLNDTGGSAPLSAFVVTNALHGILNLSSNGGFTYSATNFFTGTDTFAYRATDGTTSSAPAIVTITVVPDHAPVAAIDSYTVPMNSVLSIGAPGVLGNDSDVDGNALSAILANSPTNGIMLLTNNGGFTYVPNAGYVGNDTFTYRANDGISNSAAAAVTISVTPPALFYDNFARASDPGPLAPWNVGLGSWTNTAGTMRGGINGTFSYGFAYITNAFSDYAVQARLQFPTNAFGGGIGSCYNAAAGGGHYAAWVYPENSAGGSNMLRLVKFQNTNSFGYNGVGGAFMAQTNLAAVGTNFHTVKLATRGNHLAVYFDGNLMISTTDTELFPYTSGSVSLDFWTDLNPYIATFDDVIVNDVAANDNYLVNQNSTLKVSAPGVLGNDTGVYGTSLNATLVSPPAHGTLSVTNNGGFQYVPDSGYVGPDSFTYQANDSGTNLGTATVNLTVLPGNTAPAFVATPPNRTIPEQTLLTVTNNATDNDVPVQTLTYQLISPPALATISSDGVITWTPSEAQGPSTANITTVVTDNGFPPLSRTNVFSVTVTEVNIAPSFVATPADRTINELTQMTVTDNATDPDVPANSLSYSLLTAPAGSGINPNTGLITWTPSEAQGPGIYGFTVRVVDNGSPPMSDTNGFTVTVNEVNSAPVLGVIPKMTIPALTTLTVPNSATDSDIPTNNLTYSLLANPSGAVINANSGLITWTPSLAQNNSSNFFRMRVVDDGGPPLSATNSFSVLVNSNPVVVLDSTALLVEGCSPTNNSIDPGETVTMSFAFKNVGTGPATNVVITLLPVNGVANPSGPQTYGLIPVGSTMVQPFTFSASGSCGSTITPTLQVQDGSVNLATNSAVFPVGQLITVLNQNFDGVTAPALPSDWTTSSSGAEANWRTTNTLADTGPNAAFVPDVSNVGISDLLSPTFTMPAGAMQLSFKHRYDLEASTSTNTVGYDGGVLEIKIGTNDFVDITNAGGIFVNDGYTRVISPQFSSPLSNRPAWSGTIAFYTNTVINLPDTLAGQNVQLRWRCATDNGGQSGTGWRVDSVLLTVLSCCSRSAPVLAFQPDVTNFGLATLVVTNTATDPTVPVGNLIYTLSGPAGAQIETNGVITWTPTPDQVPSTNLFTTVVSDNGLPPLSATNSFTVFEQTVHNGPSLPAQNDQTMNELATLRVTNTASDADVPVQQLTYGLVDSPAGAVIDSNGVITWIPTEAQGPSTNTITTVVTDNGTPNLSSTNSFRVVVNEINTAPVLPPQTNQTLLGTATLVVTNTAVDSDIPANPLSYALLIAPGNAAIDGNGVITWTPVPAQVPSTNVITTVVTDFNTFAINPQNFSATNSFTVFVRAIHNGPTLSEQTNRAVDELATLMVTNTASDSDIPALQLTYQLLDAPAGAAIDTNGVITWTPSEAQGPATNTITTVVTDSGQPPIRATNSFVVTVNEINSAPILTVPTNQTIDELTTLDLFASATDSDIPANTLTFSLNSHPSGMTINPATGEITWTPTEAQGPSVNMIEVVVTDNGRPNLRATNSFTVTVNEVNSAPVLTVPTNHVINELTVLDVFASGTDSDIPTNTLTFGLLAHPSGMTINPGTGEINWTPSEAQGPSTNLVEVVVIDNGIPNLSATNSFTVTVNEVNSAPILTVPTNQIINELTVLDVFASATDSDIPTNTLTFGLLAHPSGMTINPGTGEINWTPSEAQGPSTNLVEVVVIDNGTPNLSATNSFTVTVNEVNSAPLLTVPTNQVIAPLATLDVFASATDADIPTNTLTFSLIAPPAGMAIGAHSGEITWTPTEEQGPSTNTITVVVMDDGTPALGATNNFVVTVSAPESVPPPTIESISVTENVAVVTFASKSNHVYRLQFKGTLLDTSWTDVTPDITATDSVSSCSNQCGPVMQRFFRVQVVH